MKKIKSALISVYNKEGLENILRQLHAFAVTIYSTGGTQKFIEELGIPCIPVETITEYPAILGGRVKTLHPAIFGGILARRDNASDISEMEAYDIPEIDLVIVDLYPFEATLKNTTDQQQIIEKIDIGGPSMIRAAAKNFSDLMVVSAKRDYSLLENILTTQKCSTTVEQRMYFASKAFATVAHYDVVIAGYFESLNNESGHGDNYYFVKSFADPVALRYGENPHQPAAYYGNLSESFSQLNGKALSYNNLIDVEAAVLLIREFDAADTTFAIIKHTNVCGIASRSTVKESWDAALAGDPESAFGGVLICNNEIDHSTAKAIHELFFEVLIAPSFEDKALEILTAKKNRIILKLNPEMKYNNMFRSVLNGVIMQDMDTGNSSEWNETGGRETTAEEKSDLLFGNIICKHLKSNAIALVKNKQLIGKGCGQTSRIDALRNAMEKARQFDFDLNGSVMASDAFFPFNDCVRIAHEAGVVAFIQPGGSIRDDESISYCMEKKLAHVITGMRHFRH